MLTHPHCNNMVYTFVNTYSCVMHAYELGSSHYKNVAKHVYVYVVSLVPLIYYINHALC